MTIRAKSDPRFYLRFLLIGAVAIGFSLLCVYDGAIRYPKQREPALAYQELEERLKEEGRLDQLSQEWIQVVKQHNENSDSAQDNWPTDKPKDEVDIQLQYVMAGVTGTIGLWMLLVVWRARGRWIEASGAGLTSSWGQRVDYARIVSLDKRQWRKKGIAKINYEDGNRKRRLVLDDYKYNRQATDTILRDLEAKIGVDKIIGGPPEQPPDDRGS